ncbi:uncharacterized protein M6B38_265365 [Iris pallida]|uniref:CCHC-type domain-containing protein n=1 Tax=Iris pallida TaxID=29817 RepID=A0AAX6IBJ6_IRIPA|nr:uncharacterized protein M6B38_265365 [Iris pallida]
MTVTRSQAVDSSVVPERSDQGGLPPPATGLTVESAVASVPVLQVGVAAAVLGGLPPPAGGDAVQGAAISVPALPTGALAATVSGGLPPPAARPSVVIPDILPPSPQLPADTQGMMALLQQMLQTQRVQAEAQYRQAEMFRQSMENSHRRVMVALERVVPGTVQDTPVQYQCQRQRPAAQCHFCGRPGHTKEACRKRFGRLLILWGVRSPAEGLPFPGSPRSSRQSAAGQRTSSSAERSSTSDAAATFSAAPEGSPCGQSTSGTST